MLNEEKNNFNQYKGIDINSNSMINSLKNPINIIKVFRE